MKNMKRILVMTLLMTMVVSLFAGCGNGEKTTAPTSESAKSEATKEETPESTGPKKMTVASAPVDTFNPHNSSMSEAGTLQGYIYAMPLQLVANEAGDSVEFVLDQLAEMPKTEDGLTWTLKYKDNLEFYGGKKYGAAEAEYSWKMLLDNKLANYGSFLLYDSLPIVNAKEYFEGTVAWEEVGIKLVDANTLQFTLLTEMPEIDVLTTLASSTLTVVDKDLYEAGMNAERTETTYATKMENIPSNGAYRLTSWIKDQTRKFEKVETNQMASTFVPTEIESKVVSESATKLQLFETGEIDFTSVSGEDYAKYEEDPRVAFQERNTIWGFYVNNASTTNPVLKDKDFRQALFYATNRELMGKGIFKTFPSTPYFISSICMVGDYHDGIRYRKTEEAQSLVAANNGYDPEKAKALFEKAYAANGSKKITIEIVYFDGADTMKRIAEVAKEEYEKVFGSDKLEVALRAMPAAAAYDAYKEGNFELGIGARSQNAFNPWSSMKVWTKFFPDRYGAFDSEEFDELYTRTTRGDLVKNPEERIKALARMEEILIDEVPMIPIFQNDNAYIFQDRIYLRTNGAYLPGVGFAELQADIIE